jgi:probable HAF family extracellular repeat protein
MVLTVRPSSGNETKVCLLRDPRAAAYAGRMQYLHLLAAPTCLATGILTAGLLTAGLHAAPPRFTVIELPTLGGDQAVAFGINDLGDVVGWSLTRGGELHACLWDDGVPVDLGTLGGAQSRAWAINNAGTIVGESLLPGGSGPGQFKAFIVDGGVMTMLPGLGGNWSVAYAINESGEATGIAANPQQQEKMVTWTNDVVTNLGPLTPQQRSRGYGINAAGAVAGWGYTPLGGPNDALLYDPVANDVIQIGGFGQFQNAEAYDVNDAGVVVGSSSPGTGDWQAAVWYPKAITEPDIVGTVPGYELAWLYDINNGNIAVGRAESFEREEPSHAIYFDGADLYDLNAFLPKQTEGFLFEARHINERGDIAATMMVDGLFRAVVLVASLQLVGDLDGNGVVDGADLGLLLSAWGGGGPADLDGNGIVDGADLGVLLAAWTG